MPRRRGPGHDLALLRLRHLYGGGHADTLEGGNDGDDVDGQKGKPDAWTVDSADDCVDVEPPPGTC